MGSSALQPKVARRLRRSKRLGLSVPVKVYGEDASGEAFRELTQMLSVSAHGGLLAVAASVRKGQTILVENRSTQQEHEFRVVHVSQPQDGKRRVGIELVSTPDDFWRIYFPPVNARRV